MCMISPLGTNYDFILLAFMNHVEENLKMDPYGRLLNKKWHVSVL